MRPGAALGVTELQAQIWRMPKVGRFSLHESSKFVAVSAQPKQGCTQRGADQR
jgi:hypothetical protein